MDNAEESARGFGTRLKNGLSAAAKIGAAALGAAATGVAALAKQSVANYAQYEQLVGGVETLFKDSASVVEAYANNAYRTAGLSANAYMETVTSFSASLLQSLGGDTAEAARYADMAITDMADNANKMGSDISSIQNAYQGFAKQNYTMLDNLKLGYGGTKEEMERLLADAEAIAGIEFSIDSYADVVQAIHVIQEEMGIAGATAAEATETISGSFSALRAAWSNLVTGLASGGDIGGLIDNLVSSATIAAGNVMPVVEQAVLGVSALISGLAPILASELPSMISGTLPAMISAGGTLLLAVVNGIVAALPQLIPAATSAVLALAQGLITALPELLPAAVQMISDLALMLTSSENLEMILTAALDLIISLADGLMTAIPQLVDAAIQVVNGIVTFLLEPGNIAMLINAAIRIVIAIGAGLISAIPQLLTSGVELIDSLINQFNETDWGEVGAALVDGILDGLKAAWEALTGWAREAWAGFVSIFSFPSNHNYNVPAINMPAVYTTGVPLETAPATATPAASSQNVNALAGAIMATGNAPTYEVAVNVDGTAMARALINPLGDVMQQMGGG